MGANAKRERVQVRVDLQRTLAAPSWQRHRVERRDGAQYSKRECVQVRVVPQRTLAALSWQRHRIERRDGAQYSKRESVQVYKWNKVGQLLQPAAPNTVRDDPEQAWLEALAAAGICDTPEGREPLVCATIDEAPAPPGGQRPLLPEQLAIPHLAEQQRADPLLGEVFRVLETPESECHEL